MNIRNSFYLISILVLTTTSFSQNASTKERSPLNPTDWGVVYDVAATKNVTVKTDIPYSGTLGIDIYSPPGAKAGERRPAVIFLNAIGDRTGDKVKNWGIYKSWPRLVAAHGIVGISMDADGTRIQENLRALFDFLAKDGASHGVDPEKLGVYAASANTTQSNIYLMSESASKGIKAAVLYYGSAPQADLRKDLPVLFVVAEGDMAGLGQQSIPLWQKVAESRAPWTLVFGSGLPHAFDAFEDNDESRRLIQQTIAFWKTHLEPTPQPPWKPSPAREIVAATYGSDHQRTAGLLSKYIADNPNDAQGFVYYARVLRALGKTEESVSAFERAVTLDQNNLFAVSGLGQVRIAQKKYAEAEPLLAKAIAGGFRNSMLYGQLAFAQLGQNRNAEAIKSYESAFEMGIPAGANTRGLAYFNMACAYVRLKQSDKAFEMLGKAIDEGYVDRVTYEKENDLTPLRQDARFQVLLSRFPKTAN